jgi:hypothetical protein
MHKAEASSPRGLFEAIPLKIGVQGSTEPAASFPHRHVMTALLECVNE